MPSFKANEAISLFFRYYLLVMSLPLPLRGVLFGLIGRNENFEKVAISLLGVASPFFVVVGIVGSCMVAYIAIEEGFQPPVLVHHGFCRKLRQPRLSPGPRIQREVRSTAKPGSDEILGGADVTFTMP